MMKEAELEMEEEDEEEEEESIVGVVMREKQEGKGISSHGRS